MTFVAAGDAAGSMAVGVFALRGMVDEVVVDVDIAELCHGRTVAGSGDMGEPRFERRERT